MTDDQIKAAMLYRFAEIQEKASEAAEFLNEGDADPVDHLIEINRLIADLNQIRQAWKLARDQ